MSAIQKLLLGITAVIVVATDAHAGRWLSRDPIEDGAGFVQRDPLPPMSIIPRQRGEPNLYAFVRNNPVTHIDLLGLLTWKNSPNTSAWGTRVYWPEGSSHYNDVPTVGAITVPRMSINFNCCKCGWFTWKLCKEGITVDYHAETTFSPNVRSDTSAFQAWLGRAEGDHVRDFNTWAENTAKPLAQKTEDSLKSKSWSSAGGCGSSIRAAMAGALVPSAITAIQQTTATWDDPGRHTYGDPNQRP
jgi:hypothetical protein